MEGYRNGELFIPAGYTPHLGLKPTMDAIKWIKDHFEHALAQSLALTRVSAPPAVLASSGINDYLNGVEHPVSFEVKDIGARAEVVQSLAKWKRMALADYGFAPGEGLYTDMNALRPEERLDNLHSIYVDQWDWERVVRREDRTRAFLEDVVRHIYNAIRDVQRAVCAAYPALPTAHLPNEISFIHSEELEAAYPTLEPRDRERLICKERGAVFVVGIGGPLASGQLHDGRAPDYDDWSTPAADGRRGLNGDILVHYPLLDCALELSSMGIRVDEAALTAQLAARDAAHYAAFPFHQRVLSGSLPLSIGGGIGQSRLCMFYLGKAHIGEVQASIWPQEMITRCQGAGIALL